MTVQSRVEAAFAAVDRRGFLPADQVPYAAEDRALSIGSGQTNSQPTTVRHLMRLLDVREGQQVLDVGAGSGWSTALLGHLVGAQGRVRGVEIVTELVQWGAANLAEQGMSWATIEAADPDVLGLPDAAPFDRILVSAESRDLPQPLVEQLGVGGRMVAPVKGRLSVVQRTGPGRHDVDVHRVGHYAFVRLRWG